MTTPVLLSCGHINIHRGAKVQRSSGLAEGCFDCWIMSGCQRARRPQLCFFQVVYCFIMARMMSRRSVERFECDQIGKATQPYHIREQHLSLLDAVRLCALAQLGSEAAENNDFNSTLHGAWGLSAKACNANRPHMKLGQVLLIVLKPFLVKSRHRSLFQDPLGHLLITAECPLHCSTAACI